MDAILWQVNSAVPVVAVNVIVLRMVMTTITTKVLKRTRMKTLRKNKRKRFKRNKRKISDRNKKKKLKRNRMMMARSLSIASVNVTLTILFAGKLVTCVSIQSLVLTEKIKTKIKYQNPRASTVKMFATVTLNK